MPGALDSAPSTWRLCLDGGGTAAVEIEMWEVYFCWVHCKSVGTFTSRGSPLKMTSLLFHEVQTFALELGWAPRETCFIWFYRVVRPPILGSDKNDKILKKENIIWTWSIFFQNLSLSMHGVKFPFAGMWEVAFEASLLWSLCFACFIFILLFGIVCDKTILLMLFVGKS